MVGLSNEVDIIYWIDDNHYRVGRMNYFQLLIYKDLIDQYWKSNK